MSSTVRIGIIGLEFGTKVLLPAFRRVPGCEVVALCGTELSKTSQGAKNCRVGLAFHDWRKMLKEVDVLVCSAPPGPQVEIAWEALRQGIPVFAEKPLGITSKETERLLNLSREKRLTTMVDFEFPENPTWIRAKELIRELNMPVHARVEWKVQTYAAKNFIQSWKCEEKLGGGALHAFGSHVFYNLVWFLGTIQRLENVQLFKAKLDPRETHTGFSFTAIHVDGHTAQVFVDTNHDGEFIHSWRFGDLSLVNRGSDYMKHFTLQNQGEILKTSPAEEDGEDGRIAAVAQMAGRFIEGVRGRFEVEPGFAAGHLVQCLIDEAFQLSMGRRRLL